MRLMGRFILAVCLISILFPPFMRNGLVLAESHQPAEGLIKMEAEILEVETLKDPLGNAIYTVKNLSSGQTLKLYADRHRSLVQVGNTPKEVVDLLGGEKATIVYRNPSKTTEMPEVVFARISESYYI